jgi:queuine tRNA-ribosyltransferase
MAEMRAAILAGEFLAYYNRQRPELGRTDEDNPAVHPAPARVKRPPQLGDYEIHVSPQGFHSIRQLSSGEIMHSVSAPEEEANRLYIEQSRLTARLRRRDENDTKPLVIWDVGLGAASNAMAAVHCTERELAATANILATLRPLQIVSFERDLDPLKLAARHAARFPHLRHGAPHDLLKDNHWNHASGLIHWRLIHGDFLEFIEAAPPPDLIFYDPFSAKTDAPLWQAEVFARIHRHCQPRPAELYTYSASTAVRVALLSAGFYVAEGVGTGPKATTTVAYTQFSNHNNTANAPRLLGTEWLARWRRSDSKYPPNLNDELKSAFAQRVEHHPQFALTTKPTT